MVLSNIIFYLLQDGCTLHFGLNAMILAEVQEREGNSEQILGTPGWSNPQYNLIQ